MITKIFKKIFLSASPTIILLILTISVIPLSAFEAHVVNVTAKIERRPCVLFETRSYGFWKTHHEVRLYPQILGQDTINNDEEANLVFDLPNNIMLNKLKKQLLALKFNVSFYNSGIALVPGENISIESIITEADLLIATYPPASKDKLELMKNRIESANTAGTLSTCEQKSGGDADEDGDADEEENENDDDDNKEDKDDKKDRNKNEANESNNDLAIPVFTTDATVSSTATNTPNDLTATSTSETTATTIKSNETATSTTATSSSPEVIPEIESSGTETEDTEMTDDSTLEIENETKKEAPAQKNDEVQKVESNEPAGQDSPTLIVS